ncbi:MAG: cysteine--1-D-myo-inosityl 2-amino-2-deoxy-alpha-D-glucopyranoside ligase, partial [Microlunatus sp.]|nr:cysteine--1-D-myo-inosityl 2-amino-2-deoxy-alpha-D-glucopyranoside ligase [Microlunatus sp.]
WSWTEELLATAQQRLERWREAVRLDAALAATDVISQVRAALDDDLDAPAALAAVDAWAGGSLAVDGDDAEAPGQVARIVESLLGVRL